MDKLDIKLWSLAAKGQIVPDRSMLKTPEQINAIKKSAALNTAVLDHVAEHIRAGMSTAQIDRLVYDFTVQHGGIPAPLNYEGFPKSVCTSVNNVICHGIPDEQEILKDGDIINVDVSTILDGYYSDASRMFAIGSLSPRATKLLHVTQECVEPVSYTHLRPPSGAPVPEDAGPSSAPAWNYPIPLRPRSASRAGC